MELLPIEELNRLPKVFDIRSPHPDVAIESLRRAIVSIDGYLANGVVDRDDLRQLVNAAKTAVNNVKDRVTVVEGDLATAKADIAKLKIDVAKLLNPLGL